MPHLLVGYVIKLQLVVQRFAVNALSLIHILMIAAVISAASCMQAAGGLDYMVKLAERLLRKNRCV